MCMICDRINMIKEDSNPWFVKELETGYVVIGDNQHFKGYTLFLCKEHKTELFQLVRALHTTRRFDSCRSREQSFWCRKDELRVIGKRRHTSALAFVPENKR